MITVKINNSESQIIGLSVEQFKRLRRLLSYAVNGTAYFNKGFYQVKYLMDKRGVFPTGLLYIVQNYLKSTPHTVNDLRTQPIARKSIFTLSLGYSPYPEQVKAAKACKTHMRGIVVAPTGVGKSAIAALIINELQVPTLVVVPSLELKRQLTAGLKAAFGDAVVGKDKPICVENVDSLARKTLKTKYDCVIIDEFHHSGASTYRKLNKKAWGGIFYRFGLTATPFRSQDNERLLLESVLSQVIYQVDYHTAVSNDYIVPMEAYYYEIPKSKTDQIKWAGVYSDLVVRNNARNGLIASLLVSLRDSGVSTLCLVKEIAHGEELSKLANVHFANGQNEDTEDLIKFFNQNKIKALIGTTGVIGEGVDTKPAEFIIIAGLGKSKNQFMQQVGRGFRKYPGKESCKIIIFLDPSHKWTKAHFKAQLAILAEEYNIIPQKLPFFVD